MTSPAPKKRSGGPRTKRGAYSPDSPKAVRFCELYVVDFNATKAATEAGYGKRAAHTVAYKLLGMPAVQARIGALVTARSERTNTDQDTALNEIRLLALSDIGDAFDDNGALLPIKRMPAHIRRCISGLDIEELVVDKKAVGTVKKLKLWDKKGTLELLGRHLKMFTDRIEHSADESFVALIAQAYKPQ